MKLRILSTARFSFALPSIAMALLASGSLASAQTVSLDFESETAGSTTVPTGWSYTTVGAGKTYTTSAANGGTNNSGVGTGLGGVLVSDNATFGSIMPNTFLLNSGTTAGFDTSKAITGTYDFKQNHSSAYDSSAFLFGDIKAGSFPKTDAGQLLLAYCSQGGYGNSPNRLVNGTETDVGTVTGGVGGHADDVWYRATFSWTPTAGTKGNFTLSTKRLSTNGTVATMTANAVTLTPARAHLGFADLWAAGTTFDNISVTGTAFAGAYWDINSTTAGAGGTAPTGTWDGSSNWNPKSDGTDPTAAWSAGGVAIFSAGNDATAPYTVTVSGTQDIGGLSFENGTPTLTGGTLRMVSNSYAYVKPGSTATIASAISDDAGSRVLSKTGTGTLILTGDNSGASGSTILADGITEVEALNSILGTGINLTIDANATLRFGAGVGAGNIQTALNRIVASSAGTIAADNYDSTNLDFNTAGLTAARLGAVGSVSYSGTLTPQGTVYRLGGGGGTLTMANTNAVTGAGKSLIVQGNVVLAGANDHDLGTTLSAGTLTLGNAGSLGAGGLTITGGTIAASGTVATTNTIAANGDFSIGGTGTLTMGGNMTLNANRIITNNNTTNTTTFGAISGNTRTLTISGSGNTTVSGNITTTTGTLTKNGAGILILDGANTNSGTTTVDAGTLVFSGSNSSAGATTINAATLQLDSSSNGGLASGTLSLANNSSVLQAINADRAISNNVTVGANPTISGSQSLTVNGTVTLTGSRTITNNISGTGKLLTLFNITRDGANNWNLVLGGSGDTTVNGTVVLGSGTFTKSGTGTVTLNSGASSYSGLATVSTGTLVVGANAPSGSNGALGNATSEVSLGTAGGSTNASILISGAFDVARIIRIATNNTTDTGTRVLTLGGNSANNSVFSGDIFLGTASQAGRGVTLTAATGGQVTFSGVIQNPGSMDPTTYTVTKSGLGTVVLSNANTYTGATTVSAGTLSVTGSLGASVVNVNAGTLSGNGTFGGNVTIASGATHAIAVAATTGAQDTSAITGTLAMADSILNLSAASTPAAGEYVLATATVGITGTPATINYNGITGTVSVDNASNPKRLLLTVSAGGYNTWSGGLAANIDSNGDSVKNGVAWALDASDPNANAIGLLPTIDNTDPTYVIFTFDRSDEANDDPNTAITVEYGNDLDGWTTAVDDNDNVEIVITPGSPTDEVVVKLKRSTLGATGELFARLKVVVTP